MSQIQKFQDSVREVAEMIREAHRKIYGPEFIPEYRRLLDRMFPGGYGRFFEQIQAGEPAAIEFGLVFVEVKPYYFRSQYQRTRLIRMLKHTRLSSSQAERLQRILDLEHDKKMKSPASATRKLLGDWRHKRTHGKPNA